MKHTNLILKSLFFAFSFSIITLQAQSVENKMEVIHWEKTLSLPSVDKSPENKGLASMFAGFVGDELVMLGGANFPDKAPWEGGKKQWWHTLYAISPELKEPTWIVQEDFLPEAAAYGVSIQLPEGILCVGGCNDSQCFDKVFLIHKTDNTFEIDTDWPALPIPLSNATGTLINGYV